MGERIRRMTARQVESRLGRYGFELIAPKGSHRKWRCVRSGLQVVVPDPAGRQLPLGTLRGILKGAEIPETEWRGNG